MSPPPRTRTPVAVGPHVPKPWKDADVAAIQALDRGEATAHQQKLVVAWLHETAGTYDMSYRPADTHATAFAEGMRFVGNQYRKMLALNLRAFTKEG